MPACNDFGDAAPACYTRGVAAAQGARYRRNAVSDFPRVLDAVSYGGHAYGWRWHQRERLRQRARELGLDENVISPRPGHAWGAGTVCVFLGSVACIVGILFGCASASREQPADSARAREVEEFFQSGIDAFNAHDLDRFLEQFADDILMYTPTGWLEGKTDVRERFAQTFQQFPDVRMEVEDLRSRSVSPNTVVTDFRWRVFPRGSGPAFHGVGSGVYVLRGDRWVEVLEHETVVQVDEELRRSGAPPGDPVNPD